MATASITGVVPLVLKIDGVWSCLDHASRAWASPHRTLTGAIAGPGTRERHFLSPPRSALPHAPYAATGRTQEVLPHVRQLLRRQLGVLVRWRSLHAPSRDQLAHVLVTIDVAVDISAGQRW